MKEFARRARRATSIEHAHLSLPIEVGPHDRKSCIFSLFFLPGVLLGWAGLGWLVGSTHCFEVLFNEISNSELESCVGTMR